MKFVSRTSSIFEIHIEYAIWNWKVVFHIFIIYPLVIYVYTHVYEMSDYYIIHIQLRLRALKYS